MIRKELHNERTKPFVKILFRAVIEIEIEVGSVTVWSLLQNVLERRRTEYGFPLSVQSAPLNELENEGIERI